MSIKPYLVRRNENGKNKEHLRTSLPDSAVKSIVDTVPVGLTYIDRNERYLYCNATYANWRGLPVEQIVILEILP